MILKKGIDDKETIGFLEAMGLFEGSTDDEKENLLRNLSTREYEPGELMMDEDHPLTFASIVQKGEFVREYYERVSTKFRPKEVFGLAELLTGKRTILTHNKITTFTGGKIICFDYDLFKSYTTLGASQMLNLLVRFQSYYTDVYLGKKSYFNYMDVLIIQDGGCAPGKNSIVAFLTEYLEKAGRKVFIAAHGYRSVVAGEDSDFRCLVDDPEVFSALDSFTGVVNSKPLKDARGANFRSERYPEFDEVELQKKAAKNIVDRHVKTLIGVGGNGTFKGLTNLVRHLPESVQVFYTPVTIDSDILGSDTIGQYTGVEVGAEKVRCYLADAFTHKRCYIIEMMGAMGGYHALHSAVGAGAHLAVLPGHEYDFKAINKALESMDNAVIVVAEGYKKEQRKSEGYKGNAAEFFRDELLSAGLATKMKIFCEPFSRDIRGAAPNNMDLTLAQIVAKKVTEMSCEGKSRMMASVKGGVLLGEIPFFEIKTNNSVDADLVKLANRLY